MRTLAVVQRASSDRLDFDTASAIGYRYVHNSPTNYTDPSGLDPVERGRGYGGPNAPSDQDRLLKMCNGDPACEQAVKELIPILPPRPGHFYPPDVADRVKFGGGCVVWTLRFHSAALDEKAKGKIKGIKLTPIRKYYYGINPLWKEHHWIEGRLPNGNVFCLDDGTLGGPDHIFFDYDKGIFRDKPPAPRGTWPGSEPIIWIGGP